MCCCVGRYTYTRTDRKVINDKKMELLRQITRREYEVSMTEMICNVFFISTISMIRCC